MANRSAFQEEVDALLERRVANLMQLRFKDAAALPETDGREVVICGQGCQVTVFRQVTEGGDVVVTVQIARPTLAGMISSHTERGVVFSERKHVREATAQELLVSGG